MREPITEGVPGARDGGAPGIERVLGRIKAREAGPTVLLLGGIHGNETAGVEGIRRVVDELERADALPHGDVFALLGNRRAYLHDRRFVDVDLNRIWKPSDPPYERLPAEGEGAAEFQEQRELLEELTMIFGEVRGPVHVLDLHTTSGEGAPFQGEFGASREPEEEWERGIPVPHVLGLESMIRGTLGAFLHRRWRARYVLFEGGQHRDPRSPLRAEAAIWTFLASIGLVPSSLEDRVTSSHRLLDDETRGLPDVLEMIHRHPIFPDQGFEMQPGFLNFQSVRRGQILARNKAGTIRAEFDARILMPLYQEVGSDGFFLVRDHHAVRPRGLRRPETERATS